MVDRAIERKLRDFSAELRAARERKGWSQTLLAEAVGVKRGQISQLERGTFKEVPQELLDRLSRELGVALAPPESMDGNGESSSSIIPRDVSTKLSMFAMKDPTFAYQVARLVERVEEARICGDPFLLELAESTRRLAWSMYAGITVGAIEVQEISSIDICRQLLEAMRDGDSLWGGNILSPRALWNTPQGKVYHEKSLEKAKKIDIQRVFAFGPMDPTDPAEKRAIDEIRETLCQQLDAGIKIWVSTFDKLPPASAAEFIIANLKENNRDRKIVGWIYAKGRGPIVSSRFSVNPYEVERAESMFREMKEAAGGEEGWIRSEEELDRLFEKVSPRGEV